MCLGRGEREGEGRGCVCFVASDEEEEGEDLQLYCLLATDPRAGPPSLSGRGSYSFA